MNAVLSYERDYNDWLLEQARLLREGRMSEVDGATIAGEIEDMVTESEAALTSYMRPVLVHLCKLAYMKNRQPVRHWRREIRLFRNQIEDRILNRYTNPSKLESLHARAWRGARRELEDVLDDADWRALPKTSPFTLDQVRDHTYFP